MAFFSDLLKKWFYTNSSSAASSDARIPLLTATGEPKGSDTMANIASVLGEMYYGKNVTVLGNNVDLNTLTPGYYRTTLTETTNKLVNRPSEVVDYLTWIVVIGIDSNTPQTYLAQIMVATNYGIYYRRKQGDSWNSWQKVSFDIPSFYKSYQDLGSLASAIEVSTYKGVNAYDYNSVSETSLTTYYYSAASPLGKEGFLEVVALRGGGMTNIQTFYSYDGTIIKRRMWDWSASAWKEWVNV